MSSNRVILKNTLFLYVRSILILFINLYSSRVLLKTLGIEDYGLYNVVAGFVSMFGFLNTAMVNGIQRFMNSALGKGDKLYFEKIYRASLLLQIIISVFVLLLVETIGVWFVNNKMNIPEGRYVAANVILQFSTISFVVKICQAPYTSVIISNEKMNFFATQGIVEAILLLFIIFVIRIVPGDGLIVYSILIFSVSIIIFAINYIYSRHIYKLDKSYSVSIDKSTLWEMASFSGWNLFGALSGILKSQGINVLLNMFFTVSVNAARGIAYQVLGGVNSMIGNFQTAIKPQLIQSYAEGNTERYFSLVNRGTKISFYLMWMLVLPLIIAINPILCVWLGSDSVPPYTSIFTILALLTGLVDSYASTISLAIYAIGDIKYYQIIVSSAIISIIPISYVCLKCGAPPEITMIVSLIISIFAQIIRVVIWRRKIYFSLKTYLLSVIIPTACVALFSFIACRYLMSFFCFMGSNLLYIMIAIVLSVSINSLFIYSFGITKIERQIINNKVLSFKQNFLGK